VHNRRILGCKKIDNSVIDNIKNRGELTKSRQTKKRSVMRLLGLSSYNILDNHKYQVAFQYVPPYIEESHNHEKD